MSQPPSICVPSMLRRRTTAPSTPISVESNVDKYNWSPTSVMLSLLPNSIHSRISKMPLLRRTKSGPMRSEPGKQSHNHSRTWSASGITTPMSEDTETETMVASDGENALGPLWFSGQRSEPVGESIEKGGQPGSGVEWRSGRPGMELLISAVDESKNAARSTAYDAAFERNAYLDGLSYLLRGLPKDLDPKEVATLRKALPESVAKSPSAGRSSAFRPRSFDGPSDDGQPTLLQQMLRLVVARAIVWFCIIWPYVLLLLRMGAHYERKYKVSEQLLGGGIVLLNAIGERSSAVSRVIGSMGDGAVGRIVTDAFAWTVQGVATGVSEGVEEGLSLTGEKWMTS
ncbi:hypothetical protein DL546_007257 [Coniochaeta pulveracea]|uniref:Uncharacterized protein n=1 Tax=Coniochaeta pulveracea TaxID=177199 RepID=A0A420YG20_9PEZI|nr:hypothetical protein DL546_007257 [Coniochaeta pulveracea]